MGQREPINIQATTIVGVVATGFRLTLHHYWALITAAFWGILAAGLGQPFDAAAERALERDRVDAWLLLAAMGYVVSALGGSAAFLNMVRVCDRLIDPSGGDDRADAPLGWVLRRLGALLAVDVIVLASLVPLLILLPLGVFVWVRWCVAGVVIALERKGPLGALARSSQLVRGSWWHTFGVLLVSTVVYGLSGLALFFGWGLARDALGLGGAGPAAPGIVRAAIEAVPTLVVVPFWSATLVVLYYELRARAAALSPDLSGAGVGGDSEDDAGDRSPGRTAP